MRKVKLYRFTFRKGKYVVFINRNLDFSFTSKKKARSFLSKVNSYFNTHLQIQNTHYLNFVTFYRRIFFHLPNHITFHIDNEMSQIDFHFKRALTISSDNSNTFVHLSTMKIYEHLLECYDTSFQFFEKRNESIDTSFINTQKKLISATQKELTEFQFKLINENISFHNKPKGLLFKLRTG